MPLSDLPNEIREKYDVFEYRHSIAILQHDFPNEYADIIANLNSFALKRSDIIKAGGGKSPISALLDGFLYLREWREHNFNTRIIVDGIEKFTPTHKIDCYKNRIALDIEWNNKDPFFDRDLNNFRLLYDRDAISVAIIITRCTSLQEIFNSLGRKIGKKYGASTTHMNKLLPRLQGGSGGGCPILVFGISPVLYDPNT